MSTIETTPMNNSTLLRVYSEKEEIEVQPEYQRNGEIWTLEKRQLLLDSIFNDYDIPKIYLHALRESMIMSDGKKVNYAIIDGRQRLETIWDFIDGKFSLSDDFVYLRDPSIKLNGLTYTDISKKYPKLKVRFDGFVLPVILVKTDDIDLIEDMFSRLNEAVPLNSAEKRNAFGGPLPRLILELTKHKFFTSKVNFRNNRYQHQEVITKILFLEEKQTIEEKIYDTKKIYLDSFVKAYKMNSNLDANGLVSRATSALNSMTPYFIDKDPLLRSQSAIIYYLLFRTAINQGRLSNLSHEKFVEFKEKVESNRALAGTDFEKADYDLLEYDRLTIQGTNDASSIRERLRIICNFFNLMQPKLK